MKEQSHKTQLTETLSAMADNQASELELARVLKASQSDSSVVDTWSRYQLARQAIRGDTPTQLAPSDFASHVSEALDAEPPIKGSATPGNLSRWWTGLGRVAVAASVTGAVVIGAQLYQSDVAPTGDAAVAETSAPEARQNDVNAADNSLPIGFGAPALPARQVSAQSGGYQPQQRRREVIFEPRQPNVKVSNEQIRAYLGQLLERHTDHAAVNSAQSMLPYARVPLIEQE